MKRLPKRSEIRVTGADGVTHTGRGDGLALAVRDLGEQHARLTAELKTIASTRGSTFADAAAVCAGLSENERQASRYTLTVSGAHVAAALACAAYLDDPTMERAAVVAARYQLAEAIVEARA